MAILNRPRFVYVPNVVVGKAAQSLHFFRLPRLGAYFAARLKLRVTMDASVLRAAGLRPCRVAPALPHVPVPPAVERKLTPAAEEPAAEAEPAEDDEDGEKKAAPKAAPAAERPIDPRADAEACLKDAVLPVRQYALCLDTLGQERPLTDQQVRFRWPRAAHSASCTRASCRWIWQGASQGPCSVPWSALTAARSWASSSAGWRCARWRTLRAALHSPPTKRPKKPVRRMSRLHPSPF